MPIGLRSLCSCRDPYLHSWVLSFHPLGRQRSLFAIATRRDGVILSPCQVGANPLNGLRTGHSSSISAFWAGNCCLRHPFSPVLKKGGGILLLCWTGLTWPQDIMPATMPALKYRHEAPPRLVAEAPHPVVHTGGGYYPRLASTFPAPSFTPKLCVLSFIAHLSIKQNIYRSAISMTHPQIDSVQVREHRKVCQLKWGYSIRAHLCPDNFFHLGCFDCD